MKSNIFSSPVLFINFVNIFILSDVTLCQQNDVSFRGKYLNKFNTYHTQILGDVYVVDFYTVFIKGFSYDGKSHDAYFMVGSSLLPNNEGILVPNEEGRTNVLNQYINRDITLKLPKKVTEITWLAVYDIFKLKTLADVKIPEGFQPPMSQKIDPIKGKSHGVKSGTVTVIDSKTIKIESFSYDGRGSEVYFWIEKGYKADIENKKIPDENGYLSPLHSYSDETIVLELPGNLTVFDIRWLSIYDVAQNENYGVLVFPQEMNIPPALTNVIPHENRLPNCEQLHKELQISWEVFGPQITIELAGMIGTDDYMAFGISGSQEQSQMLKADVSVLYVSGWQGIAVDYNITEKAPCTKTMDSYKGVCPDLKVGGLDDLQYITHEIKDNVTIMTYRRNLLSADSGDKNYTDSETYVIWAVGHLSRKKEPLFHYLYPKGNVKLKFGRAPSKNCYYFTTKMKTVNTIEEKSWTPEVIKDSLITNFTFTLGPSGGKMGYESYTKHSSQHLVWYVNGLLAPEIYVERNKKYRFIVQGGNDIYSTMFNNPLYITNDQDGGHERLTSQEQKRVKIYAGVNFERREEPIPFAGGRLCLWENRNVDFRLLKRFPTFLDFRNELRFRCDEGKPGYLEWVPNKTIPDVVYYQSYKQSFMGWKIHVVDEIPASGSLIVQPSLLIIIMGCKLVSTLSYS